MEQVPPQLMPLQGPSALNPGRGGGRSRGRGGDQGRTGGGKGKGGGVQVKSKQDARANAVARLAHYGGGGKTKSEGSTKRGDGYRVTKLG